MILARRLLSVTENQKLRPVSRLQQKYTLYVVGFANLSLVEATAGQQSWAKRDEQTTHRGEHRRRLQNSRQIYFVYMTRLV